MSKKAYYDKNKSFHAWIPSTLHEWFAEYLEKYSYGDSLAARFKLFLYELQKQEEKGITIATPKQARQEDQSDLFTKFDNVEAELICMRRTGKNLENWNTLGAESRARACEICKIRTRNFWKACQELKQECKEAQRR